MQMLSQYFFSYRGKKSINDIVEKKISSEPIYDFLTDDGIRHELWSISETENLNSIEESFKNVPCLYVADGHHRTAAAARIGQKKKRKIKIIQARRNIIFSWRYYSLKIN